MAKLKKALSRPFASISQEWDRMAERERRLVMVLGVTMGIGIIAVGGFLFSSSLADTADRNAEMRGALKAIARNRVEYLQAKQKMAAMAVRIGTRPPQIASDLEAAARQVGIQIPETNERTPKPVGRRYLEHNVDVKLREVDLKQLGQFLYRLETGGRMIYVTRLYVQRRFAERDKVNVELTATAIEQLKKERPAKNKKGAPRGARKRT